MEHRRYIILTLEEIVRLNDICFEELVTIPPAPIGTTKYMDTSSGITTITPDVEDLALRSEEVKNIISKPKYSLEELIDMGLIETDE